MKFGKIFKKIEHTVNKGGKIFDKAVVHPADKLFNKGQINGVHLFGKGSEGSKILGKVSGGLHTGAKYISKTGEEIGKIANNDKVQAILGSNPLGNALLSGAKAVSVGLQGVGKTADMASGLTKQKNYQGDASKVIGNVLERAKNTSDSAKDIQFH